MTIFIASISFVAGFAACWLAKDRITVLFTSTEDVIKTLEARAAALRAAL